MNHAPAPGQRGFARRASSAALAAALLVISACTEGESRGGFADASPSPSLQPVRRLAGRPEGPALRSACSLDAHIARRLARGYYKGRSPDIVSVPAGANYIGSATATTHSGPRDLLQRVPLVLYGPGFVKAQGNVEVAREVTLADLAPTLAGLVGFEWPKTGGAPLDEVLTDRGDGARRPALVVVVVWDGGGWNVLRRWPDAWPQLRRMMAQGSSVTGVTVGSSPSVTPAIHATIGTGEFPSTHGIVDISLRDGRDVVGSWDGGRPTYLEASTLADLYDLSTGNRAKIAMIAEKGWHLGMIGHGAELDGADEDIAVMGDTPEKLYTTEGVYSMPDYLNSVGGYEQDVRRVDLVDGQLDSTWLGHPVLADPEKARVSPVFTLYQRRLLEALISREGLGSDEVPDLLYTNLKQLDLVGHLYNMVSPEVENALRYSDETLGRLRRFLDAEVGRGRWVMAVTADHGQTPAAADTGGWPIDIEELAADIAGRFELDAAELIPEDRPGATWLDHDLLRRKGVTLRQVASFMLEVTIGDNVPDDETIPPEYGGRADEKIFEAAFPYVWMPEVSSCVNES